MLTVLVAVLILGLQLIFEDRATDRQVERDASQALREERLENLRFVRDRSSRDIVVDRPFAGLDLTDQDLTGLQLQNADFTGAVLDGADLTTANLAGAVFDHASMRETSLWGAVLTSADFYQTDLSSADLGSTSIHKTVFYEAKMQAANFGQADIARTIFAGATDLTRTIGLKDAHTYRSCAEPDVMLPPDVEIPWNDNCNYRLSLWFEDSEVVPSLPQ